MKTPAVLPTVNPAPKAGSALAELVLAPALATVSGKYFPSHARWREAPSSDASYDVDRARLLWEESVRMTKLTPEESPLLITESARHARTPADSR